MQAEEKAVSSASTRQFPPTIDLIKITNDHDVKTEEGKDTQCGAWELFLQGFGYVASFELEEWFHLLLLYLYTCNTHALTHTTISL